MERSQFARRRFLKSSALLGIGAVAPIGPASAQSQGEPAVRKVVGPSSAEVQAENTPFTHGNEPALVTNPGSDFMVDLFKATGIKYVAAMAGSSFRGLHESIVNYGGNKDPELIVCVHEEVSAAIAHGYAKASGKPMACLVHNVVGLLHASMAIYNAWCDRAPMMVIAGNSLDATKRRPGVEWVHSVQDLGAFVREYVKYDDTPLSLRHYAESYMRAYEVSLTPPYEPVMIVADSELQEEAVTDRAVLSVPRRAPVSPPTGDSATLNRIADLLIAAERPVIAVDRAARSQEGVDLLVRFAELLNAPVIDKAGRMNMPTTHYLSQTSRQNELISTADVILGLELTDVWGLVNTLPDTVARKSRRVAREDAKVIAISANYGYLRSVVQDAQRYFPADVTVDADAQACLPDLIEAVERRLTPERRTTLAGRLAAMKNAHDRMRAADAEEAANGWDVSPISTARLCMELWDQIKDLDWALVSDVGFVSGWPQRLWDITKYYQYIGGQGGYGIGYGAPASVGAALAHRDAGRIAVAIQTDGDLMMLPGTLWTAAHHSVPLLMVMHNNGAWHQETMHLKRMSSRRNRGPETWGIGTVIDNPSINFATLAQSMGVWAEGPIDDPRKLPAAIRRALRVVKSGRPALLDIRTQAR